jgi:hypothetical protein
MTLYPTYELPNNPFGISLIRAPKRFVENSLVILFDLVVSGVPSASGVIMALLCLHFAVVSQLLICL